MDFKIILSNIINILKGVVLGQIPAIVEAVTGFLVDAEQRIEALARVYKEDKDMEFIKSSLKEETQILMTQLMALEIIGAEMAEEIVNQVVADLRKMITYDINGTL